MPISCILSPASALIQKDPDLAFGRIPCHRPEFVVAGNHPGGIRQVPLQMDGVKLAAGRTQPAADAAVQIDRRRAAPEASARLAPDLLLRERFPQIVEGPLGVPGPDARHLPVAVVVACDENIRLVQLDKLSPVAVNGERLAGMHEAVHGLRRFLAVRNGVDGKTCAVSNIAADKNIRLAGLEGQGIMNRAAASSQLHLRPLEQVAPLRGLSDCLKNRAAGDRDGLLLIILRVKAPLRILDLQTAPEHDSGHSAVFREDFLRSPAAADLNALAPGIRHLIGRRGHLLLTLEAEHRHPARRAAHCGSGHIHRHIAAAPLGGGAGDGLQVLRRQGRGGHAGGGLQRISNCRPSGRR